MAPDDVRTVSAFAPDVRDGETPPERDGLELGILADFIGMELRLANQHAFADFVHVLGEDALRPGYFTILTLIALNPGISQVRIGRAAGRDKSFVAKALRRMEDDGLINRRVVDANRRTHAVSVTEAGAALHARMTEKSLAHRANLVRVIGPERLPDFVATLRRIVSELPATD